MTMTPEELAKSLGVPLIAPIPKHQAPCDPNPVIAICGECGRKVYMVEGYCCGNSSCPIQPGAY